MVKSSPFKLIWDSNALDNLIGILSHLEKQSDQAPKIVKRAILERLNLIKSNPLICELDKLKDTPNKDFRAFVVFS
jgi:plasmid stabilization system protein ParE